MKAAFKIIGAINGWLGRILSFLIFPLIAIILGEIVSRAIWNMPTNWVHESSGYLLAGMTVLAGGYALLRRAHIKVDIVYNRLPQRVRAIVDVFTALFFFIFCVVLIWKGGASAWHAFLTGETSGTFFNPKLWPIRLIIPIGAFFLLLQGLVHFILDLMSAITGEVKP